VKLAGLRTDIVILTCAISAGIHGARVQAHLREGRAAGIGFVVATVLLAVIAAVLTRNPSQLALVGAAAVFVGLIGSYALAITIGVPVLHPDVEPVEGLALFTKAVDAVGLVTATTLIRRSSLAGRPTEGDAHMNKTRVARPIPLPLTALVAFFSAVAALAASNGMDMAQAHTNQAEHAGAPTTAVHSSPALSAKGVALRTDMRKLWEDHITWTRLAIISLESGTPDTDATIARLLRNQSEIGNAITPYYGISAGNDLTQKLKGHILIAADVIAAAKAGDQAKLAGAQAKWVANADQIAALLNSVNPRYWKLGTMKAEMHTHLKLTTEEAVARLQRNWSADVAAYDKVHRHILHMSDMLTDGIVEQFPARFH